MSLSVFLKTTDFSDGRFSLDVLWYLVCLKYTYLPEIMSFKTAALVAVQVWLLKTCKKAQNIVGEDCSFIRFGVGINLKDHILF